MQALPFAHGFTSLEDWRIEADADVHNRWSDNKIFSDFVTTEDETGLRTDKNARLILMLFVANSSQGIIIQQFGLTEKKLALTTGARIAAILQVPLATFMCA